MRCRYAKTPLIFKVSVILSVIVFSTSVSAFEWKDLWQRKDQQARALLESGNAKKAAEVFSDNRWRGVSHFEAGNFEQAVSEFSAENGSVARYNRGLSETMGGDYEAAIESFESVLDEQPDNEDAAHNLAIARELAKQQQEQQASQSEDQAEGDQSEDNDESERSQSEEQGDGQSQQSSSESSDPSEQQSPTENAAEQSGSENQPGNAAQSQAELAEDAVESEQSNDDARDESALEEFQQAMRNEDAQGTDAELQNNDAQSDSASVPVSQEITEQNQATEQWLRRIPDDPSQLLRNKIKLNHMLEHPDVGDTPEPW